MIIAIIVILLVALIFNAIYTWGIIFSHDGGFDGSRTYIFEEVFAENQSGQIVFGDKLNNPIFFIPLVFYIYGIEPPPYVINLEIDDETKSFEKIFIELITVGYVNGQKVSHKINWERKFEDDSVHRFIDAKLIEFSAKRLYDKLPVTVDRRQSCDITFVGYFVNKKGVKIPFDTTKHFEYEPYEWRIYTARGSF